MTFSTLKMTSNVVENDTIASAILKNPYINPKMVSLALLEVFTLKNGPKLSKFENLTLKYDFITLMMTADAVENDTVECPILNNPYSDPELVSAAILLVI